MQLSFLLFGVFYGLLYMALKKLLHQTLWLNYNNKIVLNIVIECKNAAHKKYNIQGDLMVLLGKSCEVEKMIRFLKETEMFEKI